MLFFSGLNKRSQLQLQPRAKPPPVASSVDFVGEVREKVDFRYPRIGCSLIPGGIPLFIFRDIFEQKPSSQSLDTPAPLGPHTNPLFSSDSFYPLISGEDTGLHATKLIPSTKEKNKYNRSSTMNPTASIYGLLIPRLRFQASPITGWFGL